MSDVQQSLMAVGQGARTKDDHYTPKWVFDALGLTFDIDVSAPSGGVPWIPAARYFTLADDGLSQPWEGRVWMNPPYSKATEWVRRFVAHRHGICLLPHAKSLWHSLIWDQADALAQPPKRVIFVGGDGDVSLPTFFAAFGDECVEALSRVGVVRVKR